MSAQQTLTTADLEKHAQTLLAPLLVPAILGIPSFQHSLPVAMGDVQQPKVLQLALAAWGMAPEERLTASFRGFSAIIVAHTQAHRLLRGGSSICLKSETSFLSLFSTEWTQQVNVWLVFAF
jgi:hypothetical protein